MTHPLSSSQKVLGMIIDSSRCIDCKACLVSCKVANNVPENQWRNWIKESHTASNNTVGVMDALDSLDGGKGSTTTYQPGGCMQCANAPCLEACPTGATYKNEADGVVLVDKGLCIGCGNCIPACPYGARFRHAVDNVVDKCDFCEERRAQGLLPACVDTCITKARIFGPIDEAIQEYQHRLDTEGAPPINRLIYIEPQQTTTNPSLQYINDTAPQDWPVEAEVPLSMRLMSGTPGKGLYGLAGLSLLGVLGMCFTQFREGRMEKRRLENTKEPKETQNPTKASAHTSEAHGTNDKATVTKREKHDE